MLMHLCAKYGNLMPEELEKVHMKLSETWNFDNPIKDCWWAKTAYIQCGATFGAMPIADITIITLTLAMIKNLSSCNHK